MKFSFIIPVYNRPEEIEELLRSLCEMDYRHPYEVVIVEDGSTNKCDHVVTAFQDRLELSYYYKENSGPGDSRNFGMKKAKGDFFIILDSDVLLPAHYLTTVSAYLEVHPCDCYGGADAAHASFTPLQKAINYVMTSFLTTGGIRGKTKAIQKFEPRSFNMGISKETFEITGGFSDIHPGEDPDLSQRIMQLGRKTCFIPNAYVYHKRRISWGKFFAQVKKFGMVRPILNKWHPQAAKITFWLPTLFIFFVIGSLIGSVFFGLYCLVPIAFYTLLVITHSTLINRSLIIGLYTIIALFIQFFGYGWGFLVSTFYVHWLDKNPREQFPTLFFE